MEQSIERAARAIKEADHILILAGAGFSADSGLDTYENLPETYASMCNTAALVEQPAAFQSFWMSSAQKYSETNPHEGYAILEQWCRNKSCWVYTSNVDGHFRRFPTFSKCLTEIHGYAGEFICPRGIGFLREGQPRIGELWSKWNTLVKSKPISKCIGIGCESPAGWHFFQSSTNDQYMCPCGLPVRPNVLMFHDSDRNVLLSIQDEREKYQAWEADMENSVVNKGKSLVILELGCGVMVPALRIEAHEVLHDILNRQEQASVTLVRINPSESIIPGDLQHVLTINETALNALKAISYCLDKHSLE